jgi:hypothetical protein
MIEKFVKTNGGGAGKSPQTLETYFQSLPRSRSFRSVVIGLLLTSMFLLAFDSVRRESVTVDESLHLTAGYTFWAFGDYRLQESGGALPQRWFALPLLFSNVQFPSRDDDSWRHPGYLALPICRKFFFAAGNNPDTMVFRGRLMAIVIALLMPLAVYGWTSRVFGPMAGLFACFLCALDPTMLAHGRLMTSDVTTALFFLMTVGCFWNLLRHFTLLRLASSSVCFGLLMVSKMMAGGLVVPMALLMFLSRLALGRPWPVRLAGFAPHQVKTLWGKACLAGGAALAHGMVALAIIWCCYGWQYQPGPDWNADRDSYTEPQETVIDSLGSSRAVFTALERWKILPDAYVYGLAHVIRHSAQRDAYLNGQYRTTGWWYYFPYCFLVKTPLTLLALIGLGAAGLACRVVFRRNHWRAALLAWLDRTSLIWSLLLVYGLTAVFSHLNIGHRHLLPIYPPLFMLAGAAGWWFLRGRGWCRATIGVLLVLQIVVIVRIHPHYLSYFNELVGGPGRGYLHLSDSNVDWGQDFPSLARWLSQNRALTNGGETYFNYFGFDTPARWGIQARTLPGISNPQFSSADPEMCRAGTYCFSATALIRPDLERTPWDEGRERDYKELLSRFREMNQATPLHLDDVESVRIWRPFLNTFVDCQFDRLRSYLIHRKPDAMIGYSILIFRLSDTELRAALLP